MDARELRNAKQREKRARNGNAVTKRYERTKGGKLMRSYRNILSRVTGVQWRKAHLYVGKDTMPREEFYAWAMACPEFHALYDAWVASGYERRLSPSVDRIDSGLGYVAGNVRWVTHSENSAAGSRSRFAQREAA